MRKLLVLTALSLALLGGIGTKSAQAHTEAQKRIYAKNLQASESAVRWLTSRKHRWRLHSRFDTCKDVRRRYSVKRAGICYLSRLHYKNHRERIVKLRAILYPLPPHYKEWLCIMSYEAQHHGKWAANTGNGYYGGLQMDLSFQRTYGSNLLNSKGTANNWTALEQMWVAEKAWEERGFNPWPNTARYCGLL